MKLCDNIQVDLQNEKFRKCKMAPMRTSVVFGSWVHCDLFISPGVRHIRHNRLLSLMSCSLVYENYQTIRIHRPRPAALNNPFLGTMDRKISPREELDGR